MTETQLTFPAFWGAVSVPALFGRPGIESSDRCEHSIWNVDGRNLSLYMRGANRGSDCYWQRLESRRNETAAFVWGHPFIAGDSDFSSETRITQQNLAGTVDHICRLYVQHGTAAFALLEGNFSLVLSDPRNRTVFLVVDKYGCDDLFVVEKENELRFASHAGLLTDDGATFDPCFVAFFLAQEGFVPAPFTLWKTIMTIGRARFIRITTDDTGLKVSKERYWRPSRSWELSSTKDAVGQLFPLLESAVETRATMHSGLLLSGGVDSGLLANVLARRRSASKTLCVTGAVEGCEEGELERARAQTLAQLLNIDHEPVVVDPCDEDLPEEWAVCTASWAGGTRVTLPLFLRFARVLRERFGEGHNAFSGQMADTLADNNYTLPSLGYRLRRLFFSRGFQRKLPLLRKLAPWCRGALGKSAVRSVRAIGGARAGAMTESLLDGFASAERFYAGRVFGFGEMPGRSKSYFPTLTDKGFERIEDWYTRYFVEPIVGEMQPETFYRNMIELSMDMVMLHLDTRLVLHAFRLEQVRAALPFLDSRVVNFFVSLPDSARTIFRKAKFVIHEQFNQHHLQRIGNGPSSREGNSTFPPKSSEQLLLDGSLGTYFRELLKAPTVIGHTPALFEHVDESYLYRQVRSFRQGSSSYDFKFISRLAALELWSREFTVKSHARYERALA